jgi:hypothetical protein
LRFSLDPLRDDLVEGISSFQTGMSSRRRGLAAVRLQLTWMLKNLSAQDEADGRDWIIWNTNWGNPRNAVGKRQLFFLFQKREANDSKPDTKS